MKHGKLTAGDVEVLVSACHFIARRTTVCEIYRATIKQPPSKEIGLCRRAEINFSRSITTHNTPSLFIIELVGGEL